MNYVKATHEPQTLIRSLNLATVLNEAKALNQEPLVYCHQTHRIMGCSTPCPYQSKHEFEKHSHTAIPEDEELALIVLNRCLKSDGYHYYNYHLVNQSVQLDYYTF